MFDERCDYRVPLSIWALGTLVAIAGNALAAGLYAGPGYDGATGNGFLNPSFGTGPRNTVGNGTAVGTAQEFVDGKLTRLRAFRWDASGNSPVQLDDLYTPPAYSSAYAINAAGTAVGWADKRVGSQVSTVPVRWDASTTIPVELGTLGLSSRNDTTACAFDLNDSGTAVGYANKYVAGAFKGERAVRWDAASNAAVELADLGTSSQSVGYTRSYAWAVGDTGIAVGTSRKYSNGLYVGDRAVRWDASGASATELGNLAPGGEFVTNADARAINSAGTIVGRLDKFENGVSMGIRAVRWDATTTQATELDSLGVDANGKTGCSAIDINSSGTAVGGGRKYVEQVDVGSRGIRWDANGTAATELGLLNDHSSALPYVQTSAINSAGLTVGYQYPANDFNSGHAILWGSAAVAIDLNSLLSPADAQLWQLLSASGISDSNSINGLGLYDPDSSGPLQPYQRMFLLDATELNTADPNGDGQVDSMDFGIFLANYAKTSEGGFIPGDFDLDCAVDTTDFNILAAGFGGPADSALGAIVPEPSVVSSLLVTLALRRTIRGTWMGKRFTLRPERGAP